MRRFCGITDSINRLFSRSVVSNSFATPWTVACQAPLSIGCPRQDDWSEMPFPSPGDLPDPGMELTAPTTLLHCRRVLYTTEPRGINAHELEQTLGDSEGQGSLVCSPWGLRVRHDLQTTINNNIPSPVSLPPPIPPLKVITEHRAQLPALNSSCPPATCFTHGWVYTTACIILKPGPLGKEVKLGRGNHCQELDKYSMHRMTLHSSPRRYVKGSDEATSRRRPLLNSKSTDIS